MTFKKEALEGAWDRDFFLFDQSEEAMEKFRLSAPGAAGMRVVCIKNITALRRIASYKFSFFFNLTRDEQGRFSFSRIKADDEPE